MEVHVTDGDGELHRFTNVSEVGTDDGVTYVIYELEHSKYVDTMSEFPYGTIERVK